MNLSQALTQTYQTLKPHSKKYTVDFTRYLFSLQLLTNIPDIKQKKILDVGTGIGIIPMALKELNLDATGLEYYVFPENDNDMFRVRDIQILQEKWKKHNLTVINQDIYDVDKQVQPGSYDVIISEATIEHLKNPKKFLDRCYELLSPGGYILITTPNIATLIKRIRFLFGKTTNWPIDEFYEDGEYIPHLPSSIMDMANNCFYPAQDDMGCSGTSESKPWCCNGNPSSSACNPTAK